MKITKRILAIIVAVFMLAMMIPMTASAETTKTYSFTLKCDKPGYEFTVYPLATLDDTTGAYKAADTIIDEAVLTQITASDSSTAALMTACQNSTGIGSGLNDKFTSSATASTKTYTQFAGLYFVKVTGVPVENESVLGGAIIVLDKNVSEVNLSNKVKNADEPTITKDFKVNGNLTKADQTYGSADTITYVLTADIAGSATNKLTDYVVTDTMGTGLDKSVVNIKSVELVNASGTKVRDIADYAVRGTNLTNKFTTADTELIGTGKTFAVFVGGTELAKTDFYTTGNKVVVTYETKIDKATAPIATNIPNTDALTYKNESGKKSVDGPVVNFKTYKIVAKKIDSKTKAALSGATFTLYKADGTTVITTADSEGDGMANFDVLLSAGTYVVKETNAPEGYTINTTANTVVLGDDTTGTVTVVVEDTKTKLPSTGGEGIMMFTIIGVSLIMLAGVLFVVAMRKRRAK